MAKNRAKLTAGQAALHRVFRKTALIFDPTYGDVHEQLLTIESAVETIRRRLVALAKERETKAP